MWNTTGIYVRTYELMWKSLSKSRPPASVQALTTILCSDGYAKLTEFMWKP